MKIRNQKNRKFLIFSSVLGLIGIGGSVYSLVIRTKNSEWVQRNLSSASLSNTSNDTLMDLYSSQDSVSVAQPSPQPSIESIPQSLPSPNSSSNSNDVRSAQILYSSENSKGCELKRPIERGHVQIDLRHDCSVTVQPTLEFQEQNRSRSRQFTFSGDGQMMIFIGTNDSPKLSQSTGSRTFTFIPRSSGTVQIIEDIQGQIQIISASGLLVHVDPVRATVTSIDGYEVRETLEMSPDHSFNQLVATHGGVEILPLGGSKKQLIDYGWRTGELAYSARGAVATWYGDSQVEGKLDSCKVKAALLFKVENRDDFVFRYSSDDELAQVLSKNCIRR